VVSSRRRDAAQLPSGPRDRRHAHDGKLRATRHVALGVIGLYLYCNLRKVDKEGERWINVNSARKGQGGVKG
jgi:hypothetical protein